MTDTMRAAVLHPRAAEPTVELVPRPVVGAAQLGIEVLAGSLNPVDLRVAAGTHPTIRPDRPYVVGFEGVGRIVEGHDVGRRVWWLGGWGAFAQFAAVDEALVAPVPDGLADSDAAAVGIAGMAAWVCLARHARVRPGEHVLILGASGSVGRLAIQVARDLGAATVTAVARTTDGLDALGADTVVRVGEDLDLEDALRTARPDGYDVVLDPLFGPPGEAAVEAAARGARIVVMGRAAGASITLHATVFERGLTIIGHRNSAMDLRERRAAYIAVAELAAAGRLRVEHDVLPLDDIAIAWRRQAGSSRRKLVVVPGASTVGMADGRSASPHRLEARR